MTHDDEFISVDHKKVCNILLTEPSENLRSLCFNVMGPLTRRAKLTVTLEVVLADVKLGAGGGELAGAVQTVALVVMWAYLGMGGGGGGHYIIFYTIARDYQVSHCC